MAATVDRYMHQTSTLTLNEFVLPALQLSGMLNGGSRPKRSLKFVGKYRAGHQSRVSSGCMCLTKRGNAMFRNAVIFSLLLSLAGTSWADERKQRLMRAKAC